ncbi:dynamin GTPase [Purpureocillium lavendulum]|uniref:Dynamin GTPase n=1 Tax=Purpureocillium lavendulum TaxID=1247861 RepID=A0AB34FLF6_9HYPO|nr:dynamin GTPase [Purpureocillium lavendulum]
MTLSAQSNSEPSDERFSHLRSVHSSYRLNQIENIRAHGVGDYVSLPQLVVCGDQSAGKSSVLEGITGIPFPRQEGLCTRFPTEIVLRHADSPQTSIQATIRPHTTRDQEAIERLQAYRRVVQDLSELPDIVTDVSRLMNIRGYVEDENSYAFAPDALRIEVFGPIGLHLSVVDLPGLISVANDEQTEEDIDAVHDMVASYLQNTRTIILAVLQASNDMANQPIIKLARKHDPEGQRTVGIITKPDLINEGSQAKIALVAKNKDSIKLKLGFFLLKNPSPSELEQGLNMATRAAREQRFFSLPQWAAQDLDTDRLGAEKLRCYLQQLLDKHIERELPKVRDEIKRKLSSTEAELRSLGDARPNVGNIRSFVTDLSMTFYELLQAALEGNYHSTKASFFAQQPHSRLRAVIQQLNTKFAARMRESGQRRKLRSSNSDDSQPPADDSDDHESIDETGQLLSGLWPTIAEKHVQDVLTAVSTWIDNAADSVIHEEQLRFEIRSILQDWLDYTEQLALKELRHLVEDERRDPLTYNHYYTDNVQHARRDAQRTAVENAVKRVAAQDWNGKLHISNIQDDMDRFMSAIGSKIIVNMDDQSCSEASTQLHAYYKVEAKIPASKWSC